MSKKQNSISLSIAEAEYIAAGSCCTQLIWMKQLLADYGFAQGMMIVYRDNTSAINIYKNLVQHSRPKHIDIRHHFIRDLVETQVFEGEHVACPDTSLTCRDMRVLISPFESLKPQNPFFFFLSSLSRPLFLLLKSFSCIFHLCGSSFHFQTFLFPCSPKNIVYPISESTPRRKRTRKEKAILQDKILTRNIVIERGVEQNDLLVEPVWFIYDIFHDNQWKSFFVPVSAYTRLVREFYYNIEAIDLVCEPSFKTKVSGKILTITPSLISEVTGIPLTNDKPLPFLETKPQPSKVDIMAVLNPGGELEWDSNKTKIPIGYVRGPERLLTWIVLQNIWPISHNNHVPLDRAIMIYRIIRRVQFCLCTHMVQTMLELHEDHSIALPYGGLITKILKATLPKIAATEHVEIPEGYFGKGTVMKSNAQIQRFQPQGEPAPPVIPNPQTTSSSGSSDVSSQLNTIIELLQSQGQSIESIKKRLADLE
ncbi:uncharacterized protein LOC132169708 [Corylus avellana]|uniref:uncharacterized protein LOC132169708 n=1 Tax=Corylus avellana TaxID=13451 RepID=UPI00286B1F18|nr:uncharacterized protein LOC132169708 [Corylus avellana]